MKLFVNLSWDGGLGGWGAADFFYRFKGEGGMTKKV